MPTLIDAAIVFFATLVSDAVWAIWILNTTAGKKFAASLSAAAIIFLGAITVVSYVNNHWMLIPAALGAFIGTYLTLWWKERSIK